MEWLILLFCVLTLAVSAYTFHKVRKIHLVTYEINTRTTEVHRESHVLYSQLVAWHELTRLLKFRRPLPPLRGWAASPDFLLIIAQDALRFKPAVIVECSSGSTTLTLARCCELNNRGHVFSLEHDEHYAAITRRSLHEQGLEQWATVIHAPLIRYDSLQAQLWYSLTDLQLSQPIEMLVVDGPPWHTAPLARYPALPILAGRMTADSRIYLDDAERDEERETLKRWALENPSLIVDSIACEKGCAVIKINKTR